MSTFSPNETQLQNYIQNKLSDAETEQLELWLANHPDVMEDLEMGIMFKQAEFDLIKESKPEGHWKNWFRLPSLVTGALVASFIFFTLVNRGHENFSNHIFIGNEFIINKTRSRNLDTEINTSSKLMNLKISLKEDWLSFTEGFVVKMKNSDGNEQSVKVFPNWDNELSVLLQLQSLKTQKIEINIYPNSHVREYSPIKHHIYINRKTSNKKRG